MTSLKGKIILVTGASSGIGYATAEALAKQGAKVIGCARNIQKLQDLSKQLGGDSIYAITADFTKEADVVALYKEIAQKFGKLDVLVNNAGIGGSASLLEGDYQGWKDMLDLNILGLTLSTREAVKLIEAGGSQSANIINLNSILGHYTPTSPSGQFYAATKTMVGALTEGLRKSAQSKNIRVTSLSPGVVETEFFDKAFGEGASQKFFTQYKVLEGKDIADAIIYILTAPPHVNIDELTITPLHQKSL